MNHASGTVHGIQRLVEKYRQEFRRPENLDFYSVRAYKEAERKYVKFCLSGAARYRAPDA